MAYFYVRDNGTFVGTATGDTARETTPRTGAWDVDVANSFESLDACVDTIGVAVADGDTIFVASDHDHTYVADMAFSLSATIISVDVTAQNNYLKGASEKGETVDLVSSNVLSFQGISIGRELTSDLMGTHSKVILNDCHYHSTNNSQGRDVEIRSDSAVTEIINSEVFNLSSGNSFQIGAGAHLILDSVYNTGLASWSFVTLAGGGPANLTCKNSDLSTLISSIGQVFEVATIEDDSVNCNFHRCKLPTTLKWFDNDLLNIVSIDVIACDAGDGYHYFYHRRDNIGVIVENTSIYLNATYDGTNGYSAEMNSLQSIVGNPLRHKLAEYPAQDLTSDKIYKVNFVTTDATTAATLTDTEFWIEVERNDSDDQALGVIQSSRNTDILVTGTTHTTNTESWTGLSADSNEYEDQLLVSAMAGVTNGTVSIYACLAKANTDVFVDPAVMIGV